MLLCTLLHDTIETCIIIYSGSDYIVIWIATNNWANLSAGYTWNNLGASSGRVIGEVCRNTFVRQTLFILL